MKLRVFLLIITTTTTLALLGEGVTRFVAPSGTDSGGCLVGSPCATIIYAVSVSAAPDVVEIASGTYTESGTITMPAGVSLAAATPRGATLVQPTSPAASTIVVDGVTGVSVTGLVFSVVVGPFVTGGGVQVTNGGSVTIDNALFESSTPSALSSINCIKFGAGVGVVEISTAVITNSEFRFLSCCTTGGGIYVDSGSDVTVTFSSFTGNYLSGAGGVGGAAIYYGSTLIRPISRIQVGNCTFTSNEVAFRNGGAIVGARRGQGYIYGSTFTSNTAINGGAVYDIGATVYGVDLVFTNNVAFQTGGGYAVAGSTADFSSAVLENSRFVGNSAQDGGAIVSKDAQSLVVRNTYIASNLAQFGAGVTIKEGLTRFEIVGTTFEGNRASDRAGAVLIRATDVSISGSTFSDNRGTSAGGAIDLQQTSDVSISNSTFELNQGDVGGALYTSGTAALNVTKCIFKGNTASTGGALYFAQSSVSSFEDSVISNNFGLSSGGGVYVADDTRVSFTRTDMVASTTPYGGGCMFLERAAVVDIMGGIIANCSSPSGEGGAIFVRQSVVLTMTGTVLDNNYSGSLGGALFVSGSVRGTLENVTFTHNIADGEGGAMYTERDSVIVADDMLVRSNYAAVSAGISINGDALFYGSRLEVLDHTRDHTKASEIGNGAGFGCSGSASAALSNSVFRGNSAGGSGGGIYTASCVFNISGVVFEDNFSNVFGGGAHITHEGTVESGVFERNQAKWGGGVYFATDDSVQRGTTPVVTTVFRNNLALGAGGAMYWEGVRPVKNPACEGCSFAGNTGRGYGNDEATAASRIVILVDPPSEISRGRPPVSIEASRNFEVNVQVVDFYNHTYVFSEPTARREMTAEVSSEGIPAGAENSTVIGSNLVTVIDGFAAFSGLFLRGTKTRIPYNLVMTTQPPSGVTKWEVFLEQCEAGFAEVAHPVFLFQCIECPSGQYDLVRATFCNNCPEGAVCEGLTRIFALEDWWWDESSPESNPKLYFCIPDRCCPVSEPGNRCLRSRPCADGWNQTSRLCSRCEEGKYEWNNKCIECGESERWRFLLVFIICVVFVLLLFGFGSKLGGELRIFIFYLQATVLVVGPVHPVIPFFGMAMGWLDVLSLDDKCFVRLTAFQKLISQFAVPFLMLGILTILSVSYVAVLTARRSRLKKLAGGEHIPWINMRPFLDAYINLFGICTVPFLHTSFQLLICRKVGAFFVLNQAPDVECYRGPHAKWVAFATAMTAFYVMVFPVSIYYWRRRATRSILSQRFWQRNLEMVRKSIYQLDMFWWEVILIARDVLLVLMYVLWFSQPRRRTLSILMVMFIFFFIHAYGLPFRDRWDNLIETMSLLFLCYTAFAFHYSNRFQLSNERTDQLVKDVMMYCGLATVSVYISVRVSYDLIGRFLSPMYAIDPSDLDVHHSPHT